MRVLDWKPPSQPTLAHEVRAEMFLNLVACHPDEVVDSYEEWGNVKAPTDQIIAEAGSAATVYFGKYKGQVLRDVPSDYLEWLLDLPDPSKGVRKFCRLARQELIRREGLWNAPSR